MIGNLLVLSTVLIMEPVESSFIFDWLGWSDGKEPNLTYKGVPLLDIPFEELSPEDKFLVEASKIAGFELTELDACQHRIVMKLKSSCGSLSEEHLAKLSVNLLNCQAAVEGRQEFPCEDKMSLKECTKEMNPDTWNAYHIMNNRARAVCYASRQQQFRALTEMTVNKLMLTAHNHIQTLVALQEESAKLKGGTSLTLDKIEKSQRDVLNRQRSLATISLIIGEQIQLSLAAAGHQKEILSGFSNDLADLFKKLQIKLANAEKQIGDSSSSVKSSNDGLLNDIKEISGIASQIIKEIDESSKKVLENNKVALDQFKTAFDNMKEIDLSIKYIMSLVETLKERSSLLSNIVGEKGEKFEEFLLLGLHGFCLITAMVVSSFLSVPWSSRLVLLAASSLNAYTCVSALTLKNSSYPRVDLIQFYTGFAAFALCDWLIRLAVSFKIARKSGSVVSTAKLEQTQIKNNHLDSGAARDADFRSRIPDSLSNNLNRSSIFNSHRPFNETPASSKVDNWLSDNRHRNESRFKSSNLNGFIKDEALEEDAESHHSSLISGRSVDGRSLCTAVSKHSGLRCRKKALKSSLFCNVHDR